ncbi:MAG: sulfatase [Planctomycetota bacterium]
MRRPNILYVMADDHAANAISCYGSRLASVFQTPNMDRLAAEGVRLTNFFATNSICTPARATIMTGQHGHINGVRTLADTWHPENGPNLALLLQQAGYETAMIGKWHLHCTPVGFDDYKYMCNCHEQGTYQNPVFAEKGLGEVPYTGYVTDIITEMALKWLHRRKGSAKPFFMMFHHKAPHDFWEFAERHERMFDGVEIPWPHSLFEDRSHRSEASRDYGSSVTPRSGVRSLYADFCKPNYVTGPLSGTENMTFEEKGIAAYQKYLKDYLRTVAGIDDAIGAVMMELERQGILDDTIVIYTSDQGMFLGEHDYQDKRWSYEESLMSPFIVRYPSEIEARTVADALMDNTDIAPTLLDYAGVDAPEAMQGLSRRAMLAGKSNAPRRDALYFRYWMHLAHKHHNPAHYGIRTGRWKLIFYYGLPLDAAGAVNEKSPAGWELYDMQNDPFELRNLYQDPAHADTIRDLRNQLDALKEKYGDTDDRYPELVERRKQTGR